MEEEFDINADGLITGISNSCVVNMALGTGIVLTGDLSNGSSWGTISVSPNGAMKACLGYTIDKYFKDRSDALKNSLKDLFETKSEEDRLHALLNMFTDQSIEFFKDMSDSDLLNFLRISC